MITRASKAVAFGLLLTGFFCGPLWADKAEEDQPDKEKMADEMKKYRFETVTTKEGFRFSIPSDMPIERKDGIVAPIPFEEYLYIKFKMIEERLGKLENRIGDMEEKILAKLDELKAQQTATQAQTAS